MQSDLQRIPSPPPPPHPAHITCSCSTPGTGLNTTTIIVARTVLVDGVEVIMPAMSPMREGLLAGMNGELLLNSVLLDGECYGGIVAIGPPPSTLWIQACASTFCAYIVCGCNDNPAAFTMNCQLTNSKQCQVGGSSLISAATNSKHSCRSLYCSKAIAAPRV